MKKLEGFVFACRRYYFRLYAGSFVGGVHLPVFEIALITVILCLVLMLFRAQKNNEKMNNDMIELINLREAALDIANRTLLKDTMEQQFQYILETCMRLIPKAKYGSVLMFDEDNMLRAVASYGLDQTAMASFRLPVEEAFLYIATGGKMNKTIIINRLEDIVLEKNKVDSEDEDAFMLRSEVTAPLIIENEVVGMLCIDGDQSDIFTQKDVHVLDYMSRQISGIIKRQNLYQEVLYLSRKDIMTGLMNRHSFECDALREIRQAQSHNEDLQLIVFDVDGLKVTNDTYGHAAGDLLIRSLASQFKTIFDEKDLCARYGGDEFIALVYGHSNIEVEDMMIQFQAGLQATPVIYEGTYIYPQFSYGVTSLMETDYNFDSAYKLSDERMYNQKRSKKNSASRIKVR